MTIAAGFVCSDGIVLASDALWVGNTRRHYAKIRAFKAGVNEVVIAGAGVGTFIKELMGRIRDGLSDDFDAEQIVDMANAALFRLSVQLRDAQKDMPEFLMAVRTPLLTRLYETQGGPYFVPPDKSPVIGCGSGLGAYLADWLFDETLPMARGRAVAAYLIQQVKNYEPDYCGGPTNIWMIPTSPDLSTEEVSKTDIASLESALDGTRAAIKTIIAHGVGIQGVDFNETTAARRAAALDTAASAAGAHYLEADPL